MSSPSIAMAELWPPACGVTDAWTATRPRARAPALSRAVVFMAPPERGERRASAPLSRHGDARARGAPEDGTGARDPGLGVRRSALGARRSALGVRVPAI